MTAQRQTEKSVLLNMTHNLIYTVKISFATGTPSVSWGRLYESQISRSWWYHTCQRASKDAPCMHMQGDHSPSSAAVPSEAAPPPADKGLYNERLMYGFSECREKRNIQRGPCGGFVKLLHWGTHPFSLSPFSIFCIANPPLYPALPFWMH